MDVAIIGSGALGTGLTVGGGASGVMNMIPQNTPKWASRAVKSGWFGKDLARKVVEEDVEQATKPLIRAGKPKNLIDRAAKEAENPAKYFPSPTYNNDAVIAAAIRGGMVAGAIGGGALAAYGVHKYRENAKKRQEQERNQKRELLKIARQ